MKKPAPAWESEREGPGARLVDRVTRRHLIGTAATAFLGAAAIFRAAPDPPAPAPGPPAAAYDDPPFDDPPFDEVYRGRRIQGEPIVHQEGPAHGGWQVTVDGQRLALMRRADGGYLSMVDHYESYATPLAAARGAVDELGPLRALSGRGH
ncbi:tyrosinase family oxidase copper chaperone [Streptomyces sp. NPDC046465]|uniref:tyrosinase family oxidase copper chaperone n=1 Tax=Streptomyces sp. NPDC046465 TaxID=3155810 RepID=UPI0033E87D6E